MQTQAEVIGVYEDETIVEGDTATLPIELDAIPGAVWQMELMSLMPKDVRVSLFERGGRKVALLRFPQGETRRAVEAFEAARVGANDVSRESHRVARSASERARAISEKP